MGMAFLIYVVRAMISNSPWFVKHLSHTSQQDTYDKLNYRSYFIYTTNAIGVTSLCSDVDMSLTVCEQERDSNNCMAIELYGIRSVLNLP